MKLKVTDWEHDAILRKTAIRPDGKSLGLIVQRMSAQEWVAIALETDADRAMTIDSVWACASSAQYGGLFQALRAAEAFLDMWLSNSGASIDKCGCKEIKS